MNNYVIALGVYVVLVILFSLYMKFHYQNQDNGNKKKKNVVNRREDNTVNQEIKGLYAKRSNPTVPPADELQATEYEASSIEEFEQDEYKMPFELWLAKLEHDSFVEYMREDLESKGILMQDLNYEN